MGCRPGKICLVLPVLVAWAADVVLTLAFQPAAYFKGQHAETLEGTVIADWMLRTGPAGFIGSEIAYVSGVCAMVFLLRPWAARRLSLVVTLMHSWCAGAWMWREFSEGQWHCEAWLMGWYLLIGILVMRGAERSVAADRA